MGHTVSPDLGDLDLGLRGYDGGEWDFLQLGFDEESPCHVAGGQEAGVGDFGGFGGAGPVAAPVFGGVVAGDGGAGLGVRETGGGEQD